GVLDHPRRQVVAASDRDGPYDSHAVVPELCPAPPASPSGVGAAKLEATRAARRWPNPLCASRNASLMAADTLIASARPWLFTTVPFRPRNTPPLLRRGSIRLDMRCNEVSANNAPKRDSSECEKASFSNERTSCAV